MKNISEKQCQDIINNIILKEFGSDQCNEDKLLNYLDRLISGYENSVDIIYKMIGIIREDEKDIKYLKYKIQDLEKQIFELKNK